MKISELWKFRPAALAAPRKSRGDESCATHRRLFRKMFVVKIVAETVCPSNLLFKFS